MNRGQFKLFVVRLSRWDRVEMRVMVQSPLLLLPEGAGRCFLCVLVAYILSRDVFFFFFFLAII